VRALRPSGRRKTCSQQGGLSSAPGVASCSYAAAASGVRPRKVQLVVAALRYEPVAMFAIPARSHVPHCSWNGARTLPSAQVDHCWALWSFHILQGVWTTTPDLRGLECCAGLSIGVGPCPLGLVCRFGGRPEFRSRFRHGIFSARYSTQLRAIGDTIRRCGRGNGTVQASVRRRPRQLLMCIRRPRLTHLRWSRPLILRNFVPVCRVALDNRDKIHSLFFSRCPFLAPFVSCLSKWSFQGIPLPVAVGASGTAIVVPSASRGPSGIDHASRPAMDGISRANLVISSCAGFRDEIGGAWLTGDLPSEASNTFIQAQRRPTCLSASAFHSPSDARFVRVKSDVILDRPSIYVWTRGAAPGQIIGIDTADAKSRSNCFSEAHQHGLGTSPTAAGGETKINGNPRGVLLLA